MIYSIEGMMRFLQESPVPFFAVNNIGRILSHEGFSKLNENEDWTIVPGGKYYVTRNGSSIIAFTIPKKGFAPLIAVASHSDSPMFKIKPYPELILQGQYTMLNTERYGGMILSTWLDRPLSVAGRVLARTDRGLVSRLVDMKKDVALIPNLAIHMNREMNESNRYNAQIDMMPLIGDLNSKGRFAEEVAKSAGVSGYVACDLYLYNRMEPRLWGIDNSYISAPRLDDLECAYTSLCAFLGAKPVDHINMYCVFDNEEVGSGTRQGADSTFMDDVINRCAEVLGASVNDTRKALASSLMISADNAHALHPNHPEKADAVNRPLMNKGIVLKFSANQKYTTDGISAGIFSEICKRVNVPVQVFANRSDVLGGSTLGNIASTHVSIPSVDIGLAQLAMHSAYETAGVKDIGYMVTALTECYNTELHSDGESYFDF